MARIITLIICCGLAAIFLYVGAMQFWQQRRNLAHAEPVDALIVHSAVKVSKTSDTDQRVGFSNSTTSYLPEVRFKYAVAGAEYTSERLYPSIIERGYASESEAAACNLARSKCWSCKAWVSSCAMVTRCATSSVVPRTKISWLGGS